MAPPQPDEREAAAAGEADVHRLVDSYVDELKAAGAIHSPAVEQAFRAVPRHRLLETFYNRAVDASDFTEVHHDPEHPRREQLELIYADNALATRVVEQFGIRMPASSTSRPSLVAEMLELLDLTRGLRVLEVGAGTGYNAALLAEIVGDQHLVVTLDIQPDVIAQTQRLLARAGYPDITLLLADGVFGAPEHAPFDRIVATVGCSDLSPSWSEQLVDAGKLLVPLAHAGAHPLLLLAARHGRLEGRIVGWTGFMPASGPLHLDGLWPQGILLPGSGEPLHQRDLWPGFDFATDQLSFGFFLSLTDRRTRVLSDGVELSDSPNGWAQVGPEEVRWWRADALSEELDRVHAMWLTCGRPTIHDYKLAFVPIGQGAAPPAGGWALDRRFFRELIWLDTP